MNETAHGGVENGKQWRAAEMSMESAVRPLKCRRRESQGKNVHKISPSPTQAELSEMNRPNRHWLWIFPIVVALAVGCTQPTEESTARSPDAKTPAGESSAALNTPEAGATSTAEDDTAETTPPADKPAADVEDDTSAPARTEGEPAAKPPSEITLQVLDYEGLQQLIASHQGSVVVVDVWSTTCGPCLDEFPNLVILHHQYNDGQDEGKVACISLSLDYSGASNRTPEDYRQKVMRFLTGFGATFENVLASEGTDDMLAKLELSAPPGVYVYNQQGDLVRKFDTADGEFTYEDVSQLVTQLVQAGV